MLLEISSFDKLKEIGADFVFTFIDKNNLRVDLRFDEGPFEVEPRHVLVIIQHDGKYLCAVHERRGVEFPGGKMEIGETLKEAAVREVMEETQVVVEDVKWFAYYIVHDTEPFCKAVFVAKVAEVLPFTGDFETVERLWLSEEELVQHSNLSFYMKDDGMQKMLEEVRHFDYTW